MAMNTLSNMKDLIKDNQGKIIFTLKRPINKENIKDGLKAIKYLETSLTKIGVDNNGVFMKLNLLYEKLNAAIDEENNS